MFMTLLHSYKRREIERPRYATEGAFCCRLLLALLVYSHKAQNDTPIAAPVQD
jgi:hypothetical protein